MRNLELGPCLYLYSDDDPLCDAKKLTELIETKRKAGQDITSIRWERSEHCGHLKNHKVEYEETLKRFLIEKLGLMVETPQRPTPRARL
jgi:predicted alpha/beta-fold hydrolase